MAEEQEQLNQLSNHIKGTTAVAFFNRNSIKIFVDSRESNEGAPADVRDSNWKSQVYNTTEKWYALSTKIVVIMVGSKKHNYDLQGYTEHWVEKVLQPTGVEIEVSVVADFIETRLKELAKDDKTVYEFGQLIAGYDDTKGLQIHRVYIVKKYVRNEKIRMVASFGTGVMYARHRMVHEYNFNSSYNDAIEFGYKTVLDASFYDKCTDGNVHYLLVNRNGWAWKEMMDALKLYQTYYKQFDDGYIIFLVHSAKNVISPEVLITLFRQYADIIVAHCVDHRSTVDYKEFYFHRLVFKSKAEAQKALNLLKTRPMLDRYKSSTILSKFAYQLDCNSHRLFMEKGSKDLLDHIISNSIRKLDYRLN